MGKLSTFLPLQGNQTTRLTGGLTESNDLWHGILRHDQSAQPVAVSKHMSAESILGTDNQFRTLHTANCTCTAVHQTFLHNVPVLVKAKIAPGHTAVLLGHRSLLKSSMLLDAPPSSPAGCTPLCPPDEVAYTIQQAQACAVHKQRLQA
jgi:hypothetical protein